MTRSTDSAGSDAIHRGSQRVGVLLWAVRVWLFLPSFSPIERYFYTPKSEAFCSVLPVKR